MKKFEIYNIINEILINEFSIKPEIIDKSAKFYIDFGFVDSELALLLYQLENKFNIELIPNTITLFSNINDLIEAIQTAIKIKIRNNGKY